MPDEPTLEPYEGVATLRGVGTLSASGSFWPTVPPGRWAFIGDDSTFYVHRINPNQANGLWPARNLQTGRGIGPLRSRARGIELAPATPMNWVFGGVIRSQEQHDTLAEWAAKNQVVRVVDHLGRAHEVLVQNFKPVDRRPTHNTPWRLSYQMTCLVLREVQR